MSDNTNRNIFLTLIICLLFYVFYATWDMISPFIISFVISYLFSPIAKIACARTKLPRWLVSLVMVAIITLLFALFWVMITPLIYDQISSFIKQIPTYKKSIKEFIIPLITKLQSKFYFVEVNKIQEHLDEISTLFFSGGMKLINKIWRSGYAVVNILTIIFLVPLISFYMIRDWEKIYKVILDLVPVKNKPQIRKLLHDINMALSGFIRGQLNICMILACYYSIALSLVGLKYGIFIGITTGLVSFIPFIGLTSGFIVSMIVSWMQFSSFYGMLAVVIIFVIGNVIESLLSPKIVGDKVGLHPVWVILALVLGASLFGFVGMLVAIPVAAIIGVLMKFFLDLYKSSSLFSDKKKK